MKMGEGLLDVKGLSEGELILVFDEVGQCRSSVAAPVDGRVGVGLGLQRKHDQRPV